MLRRSAVVKGTPASATVTGMARPDIFDRPDVAPTVLLAAAVGARQEARSGSAPNDAYQEKTMNPQTTSARRLLMFAIALNALPIMAQEGSPWRIAHPADSLTFFQSRMLNKNTVIAADAAHYAFVASRGPKGYVYLSNDTASTLALIRVDEHPIVHYDLAYPSRDHVYVIADSLEWVETQWKPVRGMIFSSSDRGATWDTTRMPDGVTLSRVAMDDVSEGIASAAVNSPVFYRTSDGWKTWTTIEFPAGRTSAFDLRAPANGTYVVDGVSLTTDAGATWQESTTPPSKGVARFDFIDALRGWGIGGLPNSISEADHRVFDRISRTTDGGRNWTPLVEATELRVDALLDVAFADERHGIATGMVGRVMATTDGGVTWSVERLPDSVNAMLQLTGIAHPVPGVAVAVGNGVILRRIVEPTSAGIDLPVSRAPALAPNPASGSTSVGFSLTDASDVSVAILNTLGERLATTSLGRRVAGSHRAALDLDKLAAGRYLVVVDAGGVRSTALLSVTR